MSQPVRELHPTVNVPPAETDTWQSLTVLVSVQLDVSLFCDSFAVVGPSDGFGPSEGRTVGSSGVSGLSGSSGPPGVSGLGGTSAGGDTVVGGLSHCPETVTPKILMQGRLIVGKFGKVGNVITVLGKVGKFQNTTGTHQAHGKMTGTIVAVISQEILARAHHHRAGARNVCCTYWSFASR